MTQETRMHEPLCTATYDEPLPPVAQPDTTLRIETHTCDLPQGHDGVLHHCETCDASWVARVRVSAVAPADREQIARARMDAYLLGTGFVMVQRSTGEEGETGSTFHYVRLEPSRVTVGGLTHDVAGLGSNGARGEVALRDRLAELIETADARSGLQRGWLSTVEIWEAIGDITDENGGDGNHEGADSEDSDDGDGRHDEQDAGR